LKLYFSDGCMKKQAMLQLFFCAGHGMSLVAVPVLCPAVRAGPGDAVAGQAPGIFMHAGLAHGKPAPAAPAEHEKIFAAMATAPGFCGPFFPADLLPGALFFPCHHSLLLLFIKR
jgi:hypothetical protein